MAVAGNLIRRTVGGAMVGLAVFGLAACGGRPSEGDVKDKLVELFETSPQIEGQADALAECMAPELTKQLSDDGLETLMDTEAKDILTEDVGDMSSEDEEKFTDIAGTCAQDVFGGAGSTPSS